MAEIAAGAVIAEEIVSSTVYLGIGAYMVSRPTMPLKATFSQIATSSDDTTTLSLTRTGHTLTIVKNKAYIFGGTTATEKLSSNEIHAVTLTESGHPEPQYSVIPAIAGSEGGAVPAARTKHAACAIDQSIAVFGGVNEAGDLIDEKPTLWLFDTEKSTWEPQLPANVDNAPVPRSQGKLFAYQDTLVLYGGFDAANAPLQDVWTFSLTTKLWTSAPAAPVHSSSAALTHGVLYLVSSPNDLSSDVHFLPVIPPPDGSTHEWNTVPFPTNPLTPGPRPRTGAELLPLTTGHGRLYLLYLFGAATPPTTVPAQLQTQELPPSADAATPYHSDLWTYQLPSADHVAPSTSALPTMSTLSEAIKPARIKDAIRGALGLESGGHSWAEVEVLAPTERDLSFAAEGKVHPGPRGFGAADVMADGKGVVMWGGVNAKGEREGDGWMIRLE